jgi:short-subunit dehydrogenase
MHLNGKTAFITGASKGLGRELARALDRRGCHLLLVARDRQLLSELQGDLQTSGSQQYPADLCRAADRASLTRQILAHQTRIDLIVHCAGMGSHSSLNQLSEAEVERILCLNTIAPIVLTAELAPLLPPAESGGVVCIGSVAGELITPGMSLYSASKHALHAFCRAIEIELAAQNHFAMLVILGALRNTQFSESIRHPASGQPGWYRRLDVDCAQAARQIVAGIETERRQLVIPGWYRPLFSVSRLLSPFTRWATRRAYSQTRSR